MLGRIISAAYDNTIGRVFVKLASSTNTGLQNNCEQYQDWGHISVPTDEQLVNVEEDALSQVKVTGYNNQIYDNNFILNPGESCNYSSNWYHIRATNGIYMQPVNTSNKENAMMGQSTNKVLSDIMSLLIDIINYLATHTHSAGTYTADLTTGKIIEGTFSGIPVQNIPNDSNIVSDKNYIENNHNLAITNSYQPKT